MKRLFDVAVSACALVALLPLLAGIAVLVLLDDGPPVFFRQQRVGQRFRRFRIWKFRTMRPGIPGAPITAAGDPRITRLGRFLRASKLDELPQLWNVLRGDMSLVGPRPELPQFVEMFRERYARILEARPGMTDLPSIRFRDEERVLAAASDPLREYTDRVLPEKLALAEEYARSRSLPGDIGILLRTARAIVRGSGAAR